MQIQIREATAEDAQYIAAHLREEDRQEILALAECPPGAMVSASFHGSEACFTGTLDGEPVLIFGAGRSSVFSDKAEVWALGTRGCDRAPKAMVKYGRRIVREFLEYFPELENYCDARYTKSLRWLKLMGFTIGEPEPYGAKGNLFCKLSIKRED